MKLIKISFRLIFTIIEIILFDRYSTKIASYLFANEMREAAKSVTEPFPSALGTAIIER